TVAGRLDSGLTGVSLVLARRLELDLDRAGLPRIVGRDGAQIAERLPCSRLDQLPGAHGRDLPSARRAEAPLDGDRGEAVSEQLASLPACGLVPSDEQHRTAPLPAECGIDAC